MLFLYKKGVYGQGVYWIGTSLAEGKLEADRAATMDVDDYHAWELYEFVKPTEESVFALDPEHKKIYTGVRTKLKSAGGS